MFTDRPKSPNGLCVITDARFKYDRDLQETQGGQPVMRKWAFGLATLGHYNWARTTRVSLYDYAEDVSVLTAGRRAEIREELREFLRKERFSCVVILQTRSGDFSKDDDVGEAKGLKGTMSWLALEAPDSFAEMAGCMWSSPLGPVMPLLNPVNYEFAVGEQIRRQLKWAHEFAMKKREVLSPVEGSTDSDGHPGLLNRIYYSALGGAMVAVDIESYSPDNLITAIGVSDGITSVSVPWDEFTPYGTNSVEPGCNRVQRMLIQDILAYKSPKIFHNYTYDVPFLEKKGVQVKGVIHDTMAMHANVYKQWRHGLQRACSAEFLCAPWKSLFKPKHPELKKDDPRLWILNPPELRGYNLLDSRHTWNLAKELMWKVGIPHEQTLSENGVPHPQGL